MSTEVKFSEWIQGGFELYKKHIGLLIGAGALAMLLASLSFGILAGPMAGGLCLIVIRLLREQDDVKVGTLFEGFSFFLPTFLFTLLLGIVITVGSIVLQFIPCIGQIASILFVYAVLALVMFTFFLIVDKKMDFWPAAQESINTVKQNIWPFIGFYVVVALIGSVGAVLCGIGIIITVPMTYCMTAVAYEELFGNLPEEAQVVEVTASPADASEPPAPEPPPVDPEK